MIIDGFPPYDGRYQFEITLDELTWRDWGWMKRFAGYRSPLQIDDDAWSDTQFIGVLMLIQLVRSGKIETTDAPAVWEELQGRRFGGTVRMDRDAEEEVDEDDAGPPPTSSGVSSSSNGDDSRSDSETLVLPPKAAGSPPSATSVSVPATSVS